MNTLNDLPVQAVVRPVQPQERMRVIDVLRGFALFGILLVNMPLFNMPFQSVLFPLDTTAVAPHDIFAKWLIYFLAESKFYTMFSMLFGLGLTILMERVETRGGRFVTLYIRRLLALLLIGILHVVLFWPGDILIFYALIGFLLIPFRKAQPRTLLIWMFILLTIPVLFNLGTTGLISLARMVPEGAEQMTIAFAEAEAGYMADYETAMEMYSQGSFIAISQQRIYDYSSLGLTALLVMGFNILGMFLLGMYFGKRQIFQNVAAHEPLFKKLLLWGLLIGLPANGIYATIMLTTPRVEPTWMLFVATTVQAIGAPLLMLAYVSGITLLYQSRTWQPRLAHLAPVGQIGLTNYLLQSLIATTLFYSYGLGLFGQVGALLGLGLTVLIYAGQVLFSGWWVKRFIYGPAEWVWRSLTYLKPQPFRKV
jgi:uncharacterized protein